MKALAPLSLLLSLSIVNFYFMILSSLGRAGGGEEGGAPNQKTHTRLVRCNLYKGNEI